MNTLLGRNTGYKDQYDKSLLYPISRSLGRAELNITSSLPFKGFDIWNCYEVSWLGMSGKPEVRVLEFIFPADSENIIESKSLKLYLNSFNNTKFKSEKEVASLLQKDLGLAVKADVKLLMQDLSAYQNQSLVSFEGVSLDSLEVVIEDLEANKALLKLSNSADIVEEVLCSNLLKSNCLVTKQPDWASVQISYKGKAIDHKSLLKYLISFRNHNEFHEQCVERIFNDIKNICAPNELIVYARYTRRGGIDINPIRFSNNLNIIEVSNLRHARQ